MVLLKYAAVGIAGSIILILLAKGVLAHLLQRREDYYETSWNPGGEEDV